MLEASVLSGSDQMIGDRMAPTFDLDLWLEEASRKRSLDLPDAAWRQVLIPQLLKKYVADPTSLDIVFEQKNKLSLCAFVVARNVPDSSLLKIDEQRRKFMELTPSLEMIEVTPPRPLDQDVWLQGVYDSVESGGFSLDDHPILGISLKVFNQNNIYVGQYGDRKEYRGKGIGTQFYQNLRDFAKKAGFRTLTGINSSKNLGFFKSRLERVSLSDVKPMYRQGLVIGNTDQRVINQDTYTVDILNEQDKIELLV